VSGRKSPHHRPCGVSSFDLTQNTQLTNDSKLIPSLSVGKNARKLINPAKWQRKSNQRFQITENYENSNKKEF
jgi:hypothetical protein